MSSLSAEQQEEVAQMIADASANSTAAADTHWVLYCGTLVFLMQAGFAMLCAGSIRAKNAQNILLKNLLDACVGAIWFWMTGYGFAYGARTDSQWGNWFIGNDLFFLNGQGFVTKDAFHNWFFQFAFAATAATIVSGAVAERCSMVAYAGYSAFLTGFVYPVVAHWIWSGDGWLSAFIHDPIFNVGVVDFAGCGVVHMVGGAAAGVGAYILGPRLGRFGGENAGPIKGHSMPLVVIGTFLLWVGWYGFNPGSTLVIVDADVVAAKTAVTTTLAAAAGGVTNLFIHYKLTHTYDVAEMCNGILAGLVSITSACAVVEPWAALVIGFVGAWVYTAGSKILVAYYIDDAVNATPVHFFAGAWGLLAPAFFARPENMRAAYGNHSRAGLFYTGDFSMLGCQLLALVSVTAWVVALMGPFFLAMNRFGLFRVPEDMEIDGLDSSKHGGSAYGFDLEAKVVPAATTAPAPAEV
ncbi:ammonium transmembrane transporter [Aureococcus anophagefferens]|uniref:Ammonium transporter n=2 Tax=Aureococcus anophagefferens TaxID=44056 RepID=A0ABR1FT90_AURAN